MNHISCDGCKPHVATVWQSVEFLNVTAGSTYIYDWFLRVNIIWFLRVNIIWRFLFLSDLHARSVGLDSFLKMIVRAFEFKILLETVTVTSEVSH
jgi:hypothetical protein